MSIGTNIKKRRFELGMSQKDLANKLGYRTRSTIAKIESGENDINQKKLKKFAEALDTTIDELFYGFQKTSLNKQTLCSTNIQINKSNKVVAIILAGGKSVRNNQNIPNQFIDILGKPVIMYILETYQNHPAIDDIYIVCLKGWEQIVSSYIKEYKISKVKGFINAANSGIQSVKNGVDYISSKYIDKDIVIFQESTRPMVSIDMITRLLNQTYEKGSANICQSMKDYVQFTYKNGDVSYIDRNLIVDLQSPEAYVLSKIKQIFKKAKETNHQLTESCCVMLMYNLGYKINFIDSYTNNIKIIRQEDIAVFITLLKSKMIF